MSGTNNKLLLTKYDSEGSDVRRDFSNVFIMFFKVRTKRT